MLRQGQPEADLLGLFIGPLETWQNHRLDRPLVRAFLLTLVALVRMRHNRCGSLLSELGVHIINPDRGPAGAKGLSNLLRSPRWSHTLLAELLWHECRPTAYGAGSRWGNRLGHLG